MGYEYVNSGLDPAGAPTRESFLRYNRMRFGAGSAGAGAVLALTLQLGSGDTGF